MRFVLLTLFSFFLIPFSLIAQDTTYLNPGFKPAEKLAERAFYVVVNPVGSSQIRERAFKMNKQPVYDRTFKVGPEKILHGPNRMWYDNGQLMSEAEYLYGLQEGPSNRYFENGQLKRSEYFKNGKAIESHYFDESGKETDTWYDNILPEYPGGDAAILKHISTNLVYPPSAKKDNIQGTVTVNFEVTATGEIGMVLVRTPIRKDLDDEAIRLVRLMKGWIPGRKNNQPSATMMTLPVSFKLRD